MFNIVYIETLLYIVHVDDIDLSLSMNDDIIEEISKVPEEQQLTSSNNARRCTSKRTTASFNERHQTSKQPLYRRPSVSFSNPLRRLNSKEQCITFKYFEDLFFRLNQSNRKHFKT